jgi:hypothetical protein
MGVLNLGPPLVETQAYHGRARDVNRSIRNLRDERVTVA